MSGDPTEPSAPVDEIVDPTDATDLAVPTVRFADAASLEHLLAVAARVEAIGLGPHALVGGLAVAARLTTVHRVTTDLDAVTDESDPTAIEILTGIADPASATSQRVFIDGVKVDVIDTTALDDDVLADVEPDLQLFLTSHRWALETATTAELVAGAARVRLPVATPAALVAMKAGALARAGRRNKFHSDLFDLLRLVDHHDRHGELAGALAAAPWATGRRTAEALDTAVLADPTRAHRSLVGSGIEIGSLTAAAVAAVVGRLVDDLLAT